MRIRHLLVLAAILGLVGGCVFPTHGGESGAWVGKIVSYQKVVHPDHGVVGYVKEYRYSQKGYGQPFTLYHVYDLDFRERGIVDQLGRATKYVDLPKEVARVRKKTREEVRLEAQPLPYNVARILDLEPVGVKLLPATPEDLKRKK